MNKKIKKIILSSMTLAFLCSLSVSAEWTGKVKEDRWNIEKEFQLTGGESGKKVENLSSGVVDRDISTWREYFDSKMQVQLYASMDGENPSQMYWSETSYENCSGEEEIVAILKACNEEKWSEKSNIIFKMSSINAFTDKIEIELGASKDGPRDYKIEYSPDGKNYYPLNAEEVNQTSIEEENKITVAFTESIVDIQRNYQTSMLKEIIKGQETESEFKIYDDIYFKISVASDYKVNGEKGLYGSSNGEMTFRAVRFLQAAPQTEDTGTVIDEEVLVDAPTKVTAYKTASKTITLKWKKADEVDGYQIYLKKGNSTYKKNKTLNAAKKCIYKIKKLSNKGTYKIRIRAYKKVNGERYYSKYTKAITVKMKEQLLPTDLSVNRKINVKVGKQKKLTVKCVSGKNKNLIKNVKYKVKDKKIATVKSGRVKGKKVGSTSVKTTVTLKSGLSKTFTTKIQVIKR